MAIKYFLFTFLCFLSIFVKIPNSFRLAIISIGMYSATEGMRASHQGIASSINNQLVEEGRIKLMAIDVEKEIEEHINPPNTQPQFDLEKGFSQNIDKSLLPEIKKFDWNLFDIKPDTFPHLLIVGGTGDGKTYLCEHLAPNLEGKTIVCNPHDKPGDFEGFVSYCGGRNYGDWKQKTPIENNEIGEYFNKLLTFDVDDISVSQLIKVIHSEMDRRYKLYHKGIFDYPFTNIIFDEFCVTTSKLHKDGIEAILDLIKEARKVKIRLFLLVKSDQVKTLKIDGQGEIRNSLTYIRLGKFALKETKRLGDPILYDFLINQEHPILVEDIAAIAPKKPHYVYINNGLIQDDNNNNNHEQSLNDDKTDTRNLHNPFDSISSFDSDGHIPKEVNSDDVEDDEIDDVESDKTEFDDEEIDDSETDNEAMNDDNSGSKASTLEEIEKEVLDFIGNRTVTVREVQRKFQSKFQSHGFTSERYKGLFYTFEFKKLGTVTEEKSSKGIVVVKFHPVIKS